MSGKHVVGVDLSLDATGIAFSDGRLMLHGETGLTGRVLADRAIDLRWLAVDLFYAIAYGCIVGRRVADDDALPALVLIETPALSRARGGVFERGYVWFEVVRRLVDQQVPVVGVDPGQIKQYATGKGNAAKGAVIDACARRFPAFETRGDDNLADATVLAAIGADLLGLPLAGDDDRADGWNYRVPRDNRKALAKIALPPGVTRG